MQLVRFDDASAFANLVGPFLMRSEPEHALIMGIIDSLAAHGSDGAPLMAAVVDGDEVQLCSVHTPPFPVVLSLGPRAAAEHLGAALGASGYAAERVNGPGDVSAAFAAGWTRATGGRAEVRVTMRLYALERVEPVPEARGQFRAARPEDAALLVDFWRSFETDVKTPVPAAERGVQRGIAEGRIWVWDDGGVVTMAQFAGPTPNGMRVNLVYTPPEKRGHGYATSCVAALSRRILASGKRYCFLFTDVANPVSNRIYARIGYRPLCDFHERVLTR